MADLPPEDYEAHPYGDLAYYHTHPSHLTAVAALCGLPVPSIAGARVLEVGCGSGFNVLAMGLSLPETQFVGVDLSETQIRHGRDAVRDCGATNVDLRVGNLAALPADLGSFDFIVAHGVYSWVPPDVRSALLALVRDRLTPLGLGYISYNTLPGWHFRGILRDLLLLLAPTDGADRATVAKAAVRSFLETLPEPDSIYARALKVELDVIENQPDFYLLHDHLAASNNPVRFTEFAAHLAEHGLQYVAETRLGTSSFAQIGSDRTAIAPAGDDLIRREQLLDLRFGRYFRQSLVCRADRPIPRSFNVADVAPFLLSPRVELLDPGSDPDASEFDDARREDTGELVQIHDPLYRHLLRRLHAAPGRMLPLAAFLPDVVEIVGFDVGVEKNMNLLAQVAYKGTIEEVWHPYAVPPRFATAPGPRPRGCPLARRQAAASNTVISRRHRPATLTDAERDLLRKLDGSLDRDELARDRDRATIDAQLERLANLAVLDS